MKDIWGAFMAVFYVRVRVGVFFCQLYGTVDVT